MVCSEEKPDRNDRRFGLGGHQDGPGQRIGAWLLLAGRASGCWPACSGPLRKGSLAACRRKSVRGAAKHAIKRDLRFTSNGGVHISDAMQALLGWLFHSRRRGKKRRLMVRFDWTEVRSFDRLMEVTNRQKFPEPPRLDRVPLLLHADSSGGDPWV